MGKIVWPHARSTLTMKCRHLYCQLYDNAAAFTSMISRRYRCHHGRATWVRLGRLHRRPLVVSLLVSSSLRSGTLDRGLSEASPRVVGTLRTIKYSLWGILGLRRG